MEWLESLAQYKQCTYITRGDFDENMNLIPTTVNKIGSYKFGMTHGHQIVPWGDIEALSTVQRCVDCDIMISGHTHELNLQQYDGRYFLNPGSLTGAYSGIKSQVNPSFILLSMNNDDLMAYSYELIGEEVKVMQLPISVKKWVCVRDYRLKNLFNN